MDYEKEILKYDGPISGEETEDQNDVGGFAFGNIKIPNIFHIEHPSREEVDEYHVSLDAYLEQHYIRHLHNENQYQLYLAKTREITLVLKNSGSAPADEIEMYVHFPDGFTLAEELEEEPDEPTPPKQPQSKGQDHFSGLFSPSLSPIVPPVPLVRPYPSGQLRPPKSQGPTIRKTNSYEVTNDFDRLKQHHVWEWPALYATFIKPDQLPAAFEVKYEITAANIPNVVQGKLVIKLEVK